ncbi:hypothetical protein CPB86DRAFT_804823 [Serendipita vermifera]|nr:hypothetical protein CPB86DRAFT_804823 [Serendipita vermifera]
MNAKSTSLGSKVAPSNTTAPSSSAANKAAWGSVTAPSKADARVQSDFPTAAELKDRADKAAATSAAQRRSLDAFRGLHLAPNAQHWDEMTEEDGDFLSGVIEFGDGKQYKVAPATEDEPEDTKLVEDRLGNDYDRNWPNSRDEVSKAPVSPSATSQLSSSHPPTEKVLFNDKHNRMEPLHQPRPPTTLLNANNSGPNYRRTSFGKGYKDSPNWNGPHNRGFNENGHADRERDDRGRRTSFSERERSGYNQGGLGANLRGQSPDRSNRFPGRNMQGMNRRDSQASSAIAPSESYRSGRNLSRESSDRNSGIRQLPPHLQDPKDTSSTHSGSPTLPNMSSRTSWRSSPTVPRQQPFNPAPPTNAAPASAPQESEPSTRANDASKHSDTQPDPSQTEVATILMNDEVALKAAMGLAAERARKRREEEEEERARQKERARKKLEELEAKMQAEKKSHEPKMEENKLQKVDEKAVPVIKGPEDKVESHPEKDQGAKANHPVRKAPPVQPPGPSDTTDSWRSRAPVRPTDPPTPATATWSRDKGTDPKKSPTIMQRSRPTGPQTSGPPSKSDSSKPMDASMVPEMAALHSKTSDDHVEILDYEDLRQLAEGYEHTHTLSVNTTTAEGIDMTSSAKPTVNLKPSGESRFNRSYEQDHHSHANGQFDDSRSSRFNKSSTKPQVPPPLSLAPRGTQEQGQVHPPVSAGLSSSRSPRTFDQSQAPYKEAPISVLDDTLSRFKLAIMHSNPEHAGMSSDDIMQGLGRANLDAGRLLSDPPKIYMPASPDEIPSSVLWSMTQSQDPEESEPPNVLIPTFSIRRASVPYRKLQAMKTPQEWRWDYLTFEPPVSTMNRTTLSVIDAISVGPPPGNRTKLRIKIPGSTARMIPYQDATQPSAHSRRHREDTNSMSPSVANSFGGSSKATPGGQWPPKSRGAEESVWRRGVPVPGLPDPVETPTKATESTANAVSTPLSAKHNKALSVPGSTSPSSTPPMPTGTWGRSPLSLTIAETLPEDPSLKAAWTKASVTDSKPTRNSLMELADEPPPQIPSSINDVKTEDGEAGKPTEKVPTPPAVKMKYDPHRAFQQVSSPQVTQQTTGSPVTREGSLPSAHHTPRTNALALTTNRTPRQPPHTALPPQNIPMNPPANTYPMSFPSPMLPMATPYTQPMLQPQYPQAPPVMGPPPSGMNPPGMVHQVTNPAMTMPPGPTPGSLWGQQSPVTPALPMPYGRQVHGSLPPVQVVYQSSVVQHPPTSPLFMPPTAGMMHPSSPALSPMAPPGMNKVPPMGGPSNPVPVTFQMPYMPGAPVPAQMNAQQVPSHARPPPQGRMPSIPHNPYTMPHPNGYPRPW